jgi:hypothetical protein
MSCSSIKDATQSYYPLKRWEEIIMRLNLLLGQVGVRSGFALNADSDGPLSMDVITYDISGNRSVGIVNIRGKSYLQAVSDIINYLCPAPPPRP